MSGRVFENWFTGVVYRTVMQGRLDDQTGRFESSGRVIGIIWQGGWYRMNNLSNAAIMLIVTNT